MAILSSGAEPTTFGLRAFTDSKKNKIDKFLDSMNLCEFFSSGEKFFSLLVGLFQPFSGFCEFMIG